jgi:hypothetical protein
VRCKEGEEVCDVCQKDDAPLAEADALQEAYNIEWGQGEEEQGEGDRHKQAKRQEPNLDSGIDIPSSSGIYSSTPTARYVLSSPPIRIRARVEEMNQMEGNAKSSTRMNRANEHEMSPSPDSSSMISFDQGFTTRPITVEDRFAFQAQQDEREQCQMSIQSQTQQESQAIQEFKQQLEDLSR